MDYKPDTAILALGTAHEDDFYTPVDAAKFPKTILRYRDDVAATEVGLSGLSDAEWTAHFGRFTPLTDNLTDPLALKYHGHQFHHYNPDIGDGRGFLFAQMRDDRNRLMDLGTKGSGQTPFSRQGDGRLTLLGGVREVLATRYLEHLGVNTSRSLSLIETGEALHRGDEPSPTRSSVLVRLSHSHVRFGTFQRLAFFENHDALSELSHYCIKHFYPDAEDIPAFFDSVVRASADMVASWMAGGFVHGVMNTDNMNITGESFDYGPYRFLPTLKSGYTAAYFDHNGLYAFARQPEAMLWNLGQLAGCLARICDDGLLIAVLDNYAKYYRDALRRHVFRRLGLKGGGLEGGIEADVKFIMATFQFLEATQTPWPQFWHDWQGGAQYRPRALKGPNKSFYRGEAFEDWFRLLSHYDGVAEDPVTEKPASLLYDEIGALWDRVADDDDWRAFTAKLATYTRPKKPKPT